MKNQDFKKEYKKANRLANIVLFLISFFSSTILSLIIHFIFYHNYTVLQSSLFDIKLPLPKNLFLAIGIGIITIYFALTLLIKKRLVLKNISDQFEKNAKQELNDESNFLTEGENAKMIGMLVLVIGIIALSFFSVDCFGYNDESIRFADSHNLIITTSKYEDFQLFKLRMRYDDGKKYYYDDAYAIVSFDGKNSYEFGNVGDSLKENLFNVYHNNYIEVEDINEAINYMKNK